MFEGVVYPLLAKGYQAAGRGCWPQGGLSGGGVGATSAGGAGSATGKEANSVAREAEKVRGEDETNKGMIESRNGSDKCFFTVRNTMNEEKLRDERPLTRKRMSSPRPTPTRGARQHENTQHKRGLTRAQT
ncbi:unnamed protein product [Polarella glacialis]|uniref:Uncharacterized protein n=1 Tax=Polarella glacialis TaxID=89957 RepID=A0A813IWV1_POLGL|nr:unnamed protein product [Polarella glacialis]CAE8660121.1 unnamed protein product [Polarella glacialis]